MSAQTRLAQAVWFWRAAGFRTKLDQNSSIVPIEHRPQAPHKTPPHLEMDAVASRTANADLREQLIELRGTGRGGMHAAQPVAQHIGLARGAQRLQGGDAGGGCRWPPDRPEPSPAEARPPRRNAGCCARTWRETGERPAAARAATGRGCDCAYSARRHWSGLPPTPGHAPQASHAGPVRADQAADDAIRDPPCSTAPAWRPTRPHRRLETGPAAASRPGRPHVAPAPCCERAATDLRWRPAQARVRGRPLSALRSAAGVRRPQDFGPARGARPRGESSKERHAARRLSRTGRQRHRPPTADRGAHGWPRPGPASARRRPAAVPWSPHRR